MIKNLKNYSTDIAASKTVMEVQEILAQSGARGIAFEYDDSGHVKSLFFRLELIIPLSPGVQSDGKKEISFKLPVKPEAVYQILFADVRNPFYGARHTEVENNRRQKSLNVAWRIMKEWLEVQFSLIRLNQAEAIEIFLPYMVTGNDRTLYQDMKEDHFKLSSGEVEIGKVE